MERKSYLTSRAFRMFLGANILTALSAMLGTIVDGIIVSHLVDYSAMPAISLSRPIIQGNYSFYQLVGLGASILVAKALGMNDKHRVNSLVTLTLIVLAVCGFTETLVGVFAPDVVVNALCTSPQLYDYAKDYFVPMLVGTPVFMATWFLGGFTAIDGEPKLVSIAMVIDNLVNLCMDVVLIQLAGLGIMGSSMATVIGHLVAIAIISTHYLKGRSQYRLTLQGLLGKDTHRPHTSPLSLLKDACSTGSPFAIASVCLTFYLYATQAIIGSGLGKDGLFIFSVMLSIMTIYNMFVTGSCSTMQQLAALQLGMGDSYAHKQTVLTAFKFMNTCLGTAFVVLLIAPQIVARMFDCPDNLLEECCYGVRIYGFAFAVFCNLYLLMVNYKLLKISGLATFISFCTSLSVIPMMWLNVNYMRECVWWSNLEAYLIVLLCVLVAAYYIAKRNKASRLIPVFLLPRTEKSPHFDLSFDYSSEAMHQSFDEMSDWLKHQEIDKSIIFKVRIIAEELMSNITRHSEQKNKHAYADVRVVINPSAVCFALTDDGAPFNPIENRDKGYGLMIANGAASEINYKYQFGQNMTTVKVNL